MFFLLIYFSCYCRNDGTCKSRGIYCAIFRCCRPVVFGTRGKVQDGCASYHLRPVASVPLQVCHSTHRLKFKMIFFFAIFCLNACFYYHTIASTVSTLLSRRSTTFHFVKFKIFHVCSSNLYGLVVFPVNIGSNVFHSLTFSTFDSKNEI